jgi:hypothetical protein
MKTIEKLTANNILDFKRHAFDKINSNLRNINEDASSMTSRFHALRSRIRRGNLLNFLGFKSKFRTLWFRHTSH